MSFLKRLRLSSYVYLLTWMMIILISTGFKFNARFFDQLIFITILLGIPMILITAYVFRLIDESEKTKALLKQKVTLFLVGFFYVLSYLLILFPVFLLDDLLFCLIVVLHVGFWLIVLTRFEAKSISSRNKK